MALTSAQVSRFLSIEGLQPFVDIAYIGRVDLVSSVLQLERRSLEQVLTLIMRADEGMLEAKFFVLFTDR